MPENIRICDTVSGEIIDCRIDNGWVISARIISKKGDDFKMNEKDIRELLDAMSDEREIARDAIKLLRYLVQQKNEEDSHWHYEDVPDHTGKYLAVIECEDRHWVTLDYGTYLAKGDYEGWWFNRFPDGTSFMVRAWREDTYPPEVERLLRKYY